MSNEQSESKAKTPSKGKLILAVVIVLAAGYFGIDLSGIAGSDKSDSDSKTKSVSTETREQPTQTAKAKPLVTDDDEDAQGSTATIDAPYVSVAESQADLVSLIRRELSGLMGEFRARVVKILADDNEGSRHQRFLLAVDFEPTPPDSGLSALKIDLAPRVPVSAGDTITVYGQYEYNDRGGVVHWTHHDPKKWREGGWIELDGTRYE